LARRLRDEVPPCTTTCGWDPFVVVLSVVVHIGIVVVFADTVVTEHTEHTLPFATGRMWE